MASGSFLFTSIDIVLDGDLTETGRQFDTMLTVISDCGGVYKGLSIIFGSLMFFYSKHKYNVNLAEDLLQEKMSTKVSQEPSSSDRKTNQTAFDPYRIKDDNSDSNQTSKDSKIVKWAKQHFQNRIKFRYPSKSQFICSRCCYKSSAFRKTRFAEQKLGKELDLARFIRQQRQTYMSFMMTMTGPEQVFCRKMA